MQLQDARCNVGAIESPLVKVQDCTQGFRSRPIKHPKVLTGTIDTQIKTNVKGANVAMKEPPHCSQNENSLIQLASAQGP